MVTRISTESSRTFCNIFFLIRARASSKGDGSFYKGTQIGVLEGAETPRPRYMEGFTVILQILGCNGLVRYICWPGNISSTDFRIAKWYTYHFQTERA